MNRRRLSRVLKTGPDTARGASFTALPREHGKHYRPDVVMDQAEEMAGECQGQLEESFQVGQENP